MKNFLTAAVISLSAMSVSAGGMPEELVEPTKTILETVEPVSTASDTTISCSNRIDAEENRRSPIGLSAEHLNPLC